MKLGILGGFVQWVRGSAAKPEDLSSIPATHMVEGENQLLQVAL